MPLELNGCVAQWLEQSAHNRLVAGSNPATPTSSELGKLRPPKNVMSSDPGHKLNYLKLMKRYLRSLDLEIFFIFKKLCKKHNFFLHFKKNYVKYITNNKITSNCSRYFISYRYRMEIKFSTSKLEAVYLWDEKEVIKSWLHPYVIKAYRKAIYFLSNATSMLDIREYRWYNLEKYKDHRSMRLNEKRRLEIEFVDGVIQVVDVLQISNHYWKAFK